MLSFDDCVYVDKKVDESLQVKCDDVIMCVRNGSKILLENCANSPKYAYDNMGRIYDDNS